VNALALDLDGVLGDTRPLWDAWLADVARRSRVAVEGLPHDRAEAAEALDGLDANWRTLLERFAEDNAPVHLRPSSAVSAALRRLAGGNARIGVFTDAPAELAGVALATLGATRRVEAVEAGAEALPRLLDRLPPGARVIRSRDELLRLGD
jgi:phosphoglycolate phosphatase-like HAD superfamily hydrolase